VPLDAWPELLEREAATAPLAGSSSVDTPAAA